MFYNLSQHILVLDTAVGWIVPLKKICLPPNLQNLYVLSYMARDVTKFRIFERRSLSWIIEAGPKSNDKGPQESKADGNLTDTWGRRHTEEEEAVGALQAEDEIM